MAANRAVVTKVYIPKYFLIIVLLCENLFKMMISFGIVIIMMLWSHVPISWNVIYVFPVLVDLILITFGVSTILAHFGVFMDDLKNLTNVGLRVLFYMSGIFYVITDRVDAAVSCRMIMHRKLLVCILSGVIFYLSLIMATMLLSCAKATTNSVMAEQM